MSEQPRTSTYFLVWVALMLFTGLTAGLSLIDMHNWSAVVAFGIAAAKTALVAAFFMHLRYEKQKIVWMWATVGIVWFSILLILTMNDYVTRGFLRVPGK